MRRTKWLFHYSVYIYSYDANRTKLLGYFRSGDRAARGLYRVSAKSRKLVVDLYDPEKQQGDCCSSDFVRQRYGWSGGAFMKAGASERGEAKDWSRRRVTTFGMPYDDMPR